MKKLDYYNFFFTIYKRRVEQLIIKKNREVILNRAKDYYENNKELLREREREQRINIENYLKKKKIRKESMEKSDIIACLKKRKKD